MQVWKKLNENITQVGFRKIRRKTFEMPDGDISDFDIKDEGKVVCILALNKENKVVLTHQFRPGPEKVLLELPGGGIEEGEAPEVAAKREFLEETGYTGDFQFVAESFDCGYSNRVRYHFVATNCHKIQEQELEKDEYAEVVEMSLEDFRKHLQSGQLTDVETGYLGLDFLGLC